MSVITVTTTREQAIEKLEISINKLEKSILDFQNELKCAEQQEQTLKENYELSYIDVFLSPDFKQKAEKYFLSRIESQLKSLGFFGRIFSNANVNGHKDFESWWNDNYELDYIKLRAKYMNLSLLAKGIDDDFYFLLTRVSKECVAAKENKKEISIKIENMNKVLKEQRSILRSLENAPENSIIQLDLETLKYIE